MDFNNLWGEEFEIPPEQEKIKKIKNKLANKAILDDDPEKQIKSKKIPLAVRLELVKKEVLRILGKQANNIICIRDIVTFHEYMSQALESDYLSVDTETDNTTDTFNGLIMGLCLYYPGGKQAYIPINHVNPDTKELLPDQLTVAQIGEELKRAADKNINIIMHNADFDYQIILRNCNVALSVYWDTMLAAQVLNENEEASLKSQYINKIDPEQEKYDINHLFAGLRYAIVYPELFAYYAATDALMTGKLYEWQWAEFQKPNNDRLFRVFMDVEMGVMPVVANMELRGICVDQEFNKRLSAKYHAQLDACDQNIQAELDQLKPVLDAWKLSPEANAKSKSYVPKKTKMSDDEIAERYPLVDAKGLHYKVGKTLVEQLTDPINLASPTQLAILFYDILKCPVVDKKQPRATSEEILKTLAEKTDIKLCKLLIERRGIIKLLSTYIDNIPQLLNFWGDGIVRTHFRQYGAKTGRFSSGGKIKYMNEEDSNQEINSINMQNIPAHSKEIRATFCAKTEAKLYEGGDEGVFHIPYTEEVQTAAGYKYCKVLVPGDLLIVDENKVPVKSISYDESTKEYTLRI